ncbi:MAG: glycosyltransferase family 4 protein [Thaumarchaeota archaeon]|nr:glycosyltransferase family 4 protein [Nitrososphaerota archaeon]
MKNEGIDILHFYRGGKEHSEIFGASLRANVPIRTELNVFGLFDRSPNSSLIDRHMLQSKTAAIRYISHGGLRVEDFLTNGRVVTSAVDVEKFARLRPTEAKVQKIRQSLDVEPDIPLLCRVGRPDLSKWSFFTLHAFSLLVERFPRVRFLIVGGIHPLALSKIRKWGLSRYFRIVNEVPDEQLIELFHSIDILAHASHIGESFGNTIVQAMAARKPIVVNSTDWADNAQIEAVEHGTTGLVANTPRSYSDALLRLLRNRNEARNMGLRGYEKALSEYSAPKVVRSLEKSYAELADSKKVKPDRARSSYYEGIRYLPTIEEISAWPVEYEMRLASCGYSLGHAGRIAIRYCWMATNIFPFFRQIRIPRLITAYGGRMAYLAAVT